MIGPGHFVFVVANVASTTRTPDFTDVVITDTEPLPSGTEIRVNFSYPVEEEENVTFYSAFAFYL